MRSRPFALAGAILFISLSILSSTAHTQSDWFWQNPLLNDLKGVTYAGADTWFAVGIYGSIYKSTDGGETWGMQESGTTSTLYSASFTSTDTGVVVGEGGLVLKTTDGGGTWEPMASGTSYTLYDVTFTSASTGIAVGQLSTIINTTDGGETWQPVNDLPYNMYESYFGVSFIDQENGVAGGGGKPYTSEATAFMLRTHDAGATWTMSDPTGNFCCYGIEMRSTNIVMAVGYKFEMLPEVDVYTAKIYKSTDGGASYTQCYSYEVGGFRDIVYPSPDTWIAVGNDGAIAHTTDNGISWTIRASGTFQDLQAVSFSSPDTGIAVGDGGAVLKTTDGGITWTEKNSCLTTEDLYDIVFTDEHTAHVFGKNVRMRTNDGGTTWQVNTSSISYYDYYSWATAFADPDTGLVVGYIYRKNWYDYLTLFSRTTDGGSTYTGVDTESPGFGYGERFYDVAFIDDTTAVALSYRQWRSLDAGATWALHGNQVGGRAIAFANELCGTIVRGDGSAYRTVDGGLTWTWQFQTSGADWHDVKYANDTHGWIVGINGAILATTDGGESWSPQTSGTNVTLRKAFFMDADNGVVVGEWGTILSTSDGGATWIPNESGTLRTLYGICMTDEETGTAVGGYGTILRTEGEPIAVMLQRYGAIWREDHAEVYWSVSGASLDSDLEFSISRSADGGLSFVSIQNPEIEISGMDFTLRDYGTEPGTDYIYRVNIYENDGFVTTFDASVETPAAAFHLSQNHPNPFNPSTEISFSLPGKRQAQLRIYDVSGRLVRVLLDRELPAGWHTARWDGRNSSGNAVASGIYFYRLQAGKLSESKKMVLLR